MYESKKVPQDLNLIISESAQTFNKKILYQHTSLLSLKRSYKIFSYKEITPYRVPESHVMHLF